MRHPRWNFSILVSFLIHLGLLGALIFWTEKWFFKNQFLTGLGEGRSILNIRIGKEEGQKKTESLVEKKPSVQKTEKTLPLPEQAEQVSAPIKESSLKNGEGDSASSAGGEPGGNKTLLNIRNKIEQAKKYPPLARLRKIEGVVHVSFVIMPNGNLSEVKLLQSSGSPILDEEALATLRRAEPFPYYPKSIQISLRFNLEEE